MADEAHKPPLAVRWDGEAFRPVGRSAREVDRLYVIGQVYTFAETTNHREGKQRKAFFAQIGEAWKNLPEAFDDVWITPDHMRKHALIATKWADVQDHVVETEREIALVMALAHSLNRYSVVRVKDGIARIFLPKSQAVGAMEHKDFVRSANDVIAWIEDKFGWERGALRKNAGRAA